MTINPSNGIISVTQCNRDFAKRYQATFPDTDDGRKNAYEWAKEIALGWHECQSEDWEKRNAA